MTKTFGIVMLTLGAVALAAVATGATHQLFVAAICGVMGWSMLHEARKEAGK